MKKIYTLNKEYITGVLNTPIVTPRRVVDTVEVVHLPELNLVIECNSISGITTINQVINDELLVTVSTASKQAVFYKSGHLIDQLKKDCKNAVFYVLVYF